MGEEQQANGRGSECLAFLFGRRGTFLSHARDCFTDREKKPVQFAWLCLQSSCIGTRERERERLWGVQQDCVFGRERERDDPYEAQTASTSSSKLLEKLAPRIATWYLFVEERATE